MCGVEMFGLDMCGLDAPYGFRYKSCYKTTSANPSVLTDGVAQKGNSFNYESCGYLCRFSKYLALSEKGAQCLCGNTLSTDAETSRDRDDRNCRNPCTLTPVTNSIDDQAAGQSLVQGAGQSTSPDANGPGAGSTPPDEESPSSNTSPSSDSTPSEGSDTAPAGNDTTPAGSDTPPEGSGATLLKRDDHKLYCGGAAAPPAGRLGRRTGDLPRMSLFENKYYKPNTPKYPYTPKPYFRGYKYKGCFDTSKPKSLFKDQLDFVIAPPPPENLLSYETCSKKCKEYKKYYFGVEADKYCYCGNKLKEYPDKDYYCKKTCPLPAGSMAKPQICGGEKHATVFRKWWYDDKHHYPHHDDKHDDKWDDKWDDDDKYDKTWYDNHPDVWQATRPQQAAGDGADSPDWKHWWKFWYQYYHGDDKKGGHPTSTNDDDGGDGVDYESKSQARHVGAARQL
ncbi:hypothetical protein EJ04DRAFT_588696 [Polyplosphaeria fusca]|uniref:WSC domain-containing protein n=1 Tax=Polyplosphaeria fusca TaxID=682080 RepID=A0A9P4QRA6_9PLEO|nr:hypothetical protein EJ04DRAFT_588696 [Polyplosphaeria fusca]